MLEGTNLFDVVAIADIYDEKGKHICERLTRLIVTGGPKQVHRRLMLYQELSEEMIAAYLLLNDALRAAIRERNQLMGAVGTSNRKRWTEEEDNILVEMAAKEQSILHIALTFNRSPGAIASRLTYLVGIQKVSRDVVGRLTGFLDGNPVEGHFEGTVTKE